MSRYIKKYFYYRGMDNGRHKMDDPGITLHMNNEVIFSVLKEILVSEFNIDAQLISPEKRFTDDLELDSLDAVDLVICLKEHIGEKVDPAIFRNAVTLQDMVDLLQALWK